ncbi:MAG: enoyl-CoA hydratase [Proteobacteria bacterium]|nr:enoyl-CoA hydratase [Pseudomonadota bacterium]
MSVSIDRRAAGTGDIVTVTLDRQDKLNALDRASIDALIAAFTSLADDPALRVVVLTGAGPKSFVGGADINELRTLDADTGRAFISALHDLFVLIRKLPVPVIARVNGYSLGAGMELAAACDLRVASENAVFGMPEVRIGVPSVIEAALLPRLVGWGRSNYLVLSAENIDAKTAYDWGFLESLVPAASLDGEIDRIAGAIAASGPVAVRAQKALVAEWERLPLEEGITAGIDAFAKAFETDEPQRMIQPFFDRRQG